MVGSFFYRHHAQSNHSVDENKFEHSSERVSLEKEAMNNVRYNLQPTASGKENKNCIIQFHFIELLSYISFHSNIARNMFLLRRKYFVAIHSAISW